jgi:hypothetical protein
MATLTIDSLIGCTSIPSFIPGGTRTIFYNTNAPTSWTKDTTSHDNKMLRVVNGTITSGGTSQFQTVFPDTARPVQGTVNTVPTIGVSVVQKNITTDGPVATGGINAVTQSVISVQTTTLVLSQIVSHTHSYSRRPNTADRGLGITAQPQNTQRQEDFVDGSSFVNNGAVNGHSHSINPANTGTHVHPITVTQHSHPITEGPHNHSFTANAQNFNVSYVDVILAEKSPD